MSYNQNSGSSHQVPYGRYLNENISHPHVPPFPQSHQAFNMIHNQQVPQYAQQIQYQPQFYHQNPYQLQPLQQMIQGQYVHDQESLDDSGSSPVVVEDEPTRKMNHFNINLLCYSVLIFDTYQIANSIFHIGLINSVYSNTSRGFFIGYFWFSTIELLTFFILLKNANLKFKAGASSTKYFEVIRKILKFFTLLLLITVIIDTIVVGVVLYKYYVGSYFDELCWNQLVPTDRFIVNEFFNNFVYVIPKAFALVVTSKKFQPSRQTQIEYYSSEANHNKNFLNHAPN